MSVSLDKIVALAKRRGFIYPGSEIYGGLGGTWDYGPLGVELKRNLKDAWWKDMVYGREDVVGLDAAIMMNPKVWEASGHTKAFTDPLVECKVCHKRFREDHFNEFLKHQPKVGVVNVTPRKEFLDMFICVNGKPHEWSKLTEPRQFNLLVKSYLGVIEGKQSEIYLRGEITQGVFVNFSNVVDSSRVKIPFGIAQIGKAFRNEITPGNFTFRSREFEQMELEFFIRPDEAEGQRWFEHWKEERMKWYTKLGINPKHLRFRDHESKERAHYARAATDIEYDAPFGSPRGAVEAGWSEFEGIHHRGDWDLSRHHLSYKDEESGEDYVPWVIETSGGVDRATLFFLVDAYHEEKERIVLKLHPRLAPVKVAVFPLLRNKSELVEKARKVFFSLKSLSLSCIWDDRGNIGKRYYAQDEIGTPWCVTIDFDTLKDDTVTVRDRDTAKQERVAALKLIEYIRRKLNNGTTD